LQTKPIPPLPVQLAKASWVAPLLFIGANYFLNQIADSGSKAGALAITTTLLAGLLATVGVVCGLAAFAGIRRHGATGIAIPATIGTLLSSVFLVILVTNVYSAYKSARDPQTQLQKIAADYQRVPLKVDDDTELTAVTAGPGELVYDYRLVKYQANQIDAEAFRTAMAPLLRTQLCPALQPLWKSRFNCKVRYSAADSTPVTEILLTPEDCGA
jgi:hypothetical protein